MTKHSVVPSRIIHAAVVLFSQQGYDGTSTREIARLAQVSEVTVYRYYKHKRDVFWSALDSCLSNINDRLKAIAPALKCDPPEIALPRIIGLLQNAVYNSPELARMIAVAFLEVHGKAEDACLEHLIQLFTVIDDYLKTNINKGKIKDLNPAIITVAMALTTLVQPKISSLTGLVTLPQRGSSQVIDEHAAFWVNTLVLLPDEHLQPNSAVKA
jgi:AcrR family transcriptional regulator